MKLLFIDDEEETRKGIEKNVNWEKLGIDRVVSFSNPFLALSYLEREPVDIILSDIRIPQMDGITLCRQILQRSPAVSIIFISGYSDKEYLMSAIRMSAVDYIEKPISVPRLEDAIERAVNRQRHALSLKQQQETAVEIIQKNRQLLLDQLMQKLVRAPLHLTPKDRELFCLNDSDYYRIYILCARPDTMRFPVLLRTLIDSLKSSGLIPSFFCSMKEEYTCLLLARFPHALACDAVKIDSFLTALLRQEHMADAVSCAYGQLLQGTGLIPESFRQAVSTLQKTFFYGYGSVLPWHTARTDQMPAEIPALPLETLKEGLRCRDQAQCTSFLESIYSLFKSRTEILPDQVRNAYFQVLSTINRAVEESAENTRQPDSPADYLWQRINTLHTLEECHRYALEKTEQFFHSLSDMLSERKIILDVIRIIQNQYPDSSLYINSIAGQVYMTPNYLSMLFKKETGKTIGTYLTEFRLKQSAALLSGTNMKLYDIAKAVGYADTNYYSRIFKKHYHMTPSEYRNHITGHHLPDENR